MTNLATKFKNEWQLNKFTIGIKRVFDLIDSFADGLEQLVSRSDLGVLISILSRLRFEIPLVDLLFGSQPKCLGRWRLTCNYD